MSDPNAYLTFFNSSFVPQQALTPWIFTMPESQRISYIVCYALILILSVLGNTSIIAIVARNPSMRSTISYLIVNMAATDLASTVSFTVRIFSAYYSRSWEWQVSGDVGKSLCKLSAYIRDVSVGVSIQSMVAMTFDRFFAVVFPMRPTPRLLDLRIVLPIIWCLSLGTFAVHLINFTLISPIQGVDICILKWPTGVDPIKANAIFYLSIITVFWLVPLTTIAILYTIIALKMRRQTIPGQQSSEAEEARRRQNKSIVKMAFAIVFGFFLCWFPHHVFVILDLFVWKGSVPNDVDLYLYGILENTTIAIFCTSFAINPYICFTFSSNFRKAFRNLFPFSLCAASRIHAPVGVSSQITSALTGHQTMVSSI